METYNVVANKTLKANNTILVDDIEKTQNVEINRLENEDVLNYSEAGLLVVADDQLESLLQSFNEGITSNGTTLYINFANEQEQLMFDEFVENGIEMTDPNIDYVPVTREMIVINTLFFQTIILFTSLYISFFIIIISLAVLAIQQIMDAIEAREEYKKIRLLGYNNRDIRKTIKQNTNKYFVFPVILGLVNSVAALIVVNNFVFIYQGESIFTARYNQNTFVICVILIIIYFVYIQLVKNIYYRIIEV